MRVKTNALDALFSEFIRRRAIQLVGGCERCLTPKYDIQKEDGSVLPAWRQLDCAHFHGRGSQAVRHDEDNAIGACGSCHMYLDGHPLEKVEFFRQRLGDESFIHLDSRRRNTWPKPDKKLLTLYFQQEIKELEC